ncbi:hypothetical protein ES703_36176 [subsurface metagenome]
MEDWLSGKTENLPIPVVGRVARKIYEKGGTK